MGRRRNKARDGPGANYKDIERENKLFEHYYKEQGIVPEEQWDDFIETLKTNLPATFRITGYKSHAKHLLKFLKGHYFSELMNQSIDGVPVERPTSIPWFPDELAWGFNITRQHIRKSPALEKLHKFLVTETESGNISRQEAVSMIPPLLMDVQSHHKVLDMCAAPGSKTAQLIEMLHADMTQGWPEGFVIANDADNKRCYIMVHQAKRLNSPCCMIVNHDASFFPNIKVLGDDDNKPQAVRYDRILCDVPCSGDGTLRKNYIIWKRWTLNSAFNLHGLQQRILTRGVELLEVNGRLVYSTCSFNPLENEAVIASVLKMCKGSVELVDISNELPGLKRHPGMTSWKVITDMETVFSNYEAVPEVKRKWIKSSMFPPSAEEASDIHLTRCIRLLPHHQDTGGFFVAVLRKVSHLPWSKNAKVEKKAAEMEAAEKEAAATEGSDKEAAMETSKNDDQVSNEAAQATDNENIETPGNQQTENTVAVTGDEGKPARSAEPDTSVEPPIKKARYSPMGFKEDPFVFFEEDEELWPIIREFYGVDSSFPLTQLLTRSHVGKKRNLYLVNKAVKQILQLNETSLKVINSGVKAWCRSDAKGVTCNFRLAQDGILCVFPYLTHRKVNITKEDIVILLTQENPFYYKFSDETRDQIKELAQGSLIYTYDPKRCDENSEDVSLTICGWKGKTSVRSFVAKGDRHHILRMCGVTDTTLFGDTLIKDDGAGPSWQGNQGVKEETKCVDGGGDGEEDKMAVQKEVKEEVKEEVKKGIECDNMADSATTTDLPVKTEIHTEADVSIAAADSMVTDSKEAVCKSSVAEAASAIDSEVNEAVSSTQQDTNDTHVVARTDAEAIDDVSRAETSETLTGKD